MSSITPNLSDWLSVPEAASEAGLTDQAIRNAINRGRLRAEKKAGVKLIHRSEFERYRQGAKRGRAAPRDAELPPFEKQPLTARALLNSGLVGMWADRQDICDSIEYAAALREQSNRRTGR